MKESDMRLFKEIKRSLDLVIGDFENDDEAANSQDILDEILGSLVELLYQDKVENQALVVFIIQLLRQTASEQTDNFIESLRKISRAIDSILSPQP